MGALFRLSFRQLASPRRLGLLGILALLPIGLSLLVSATIEGESTNKEFIDTLLDGLLISGVMPLISLVLATAAFGNEVEDRTLSYLVLKPISRFQIVAAKLLATIVVAGPLVVLSGVIATLVGTEAVGAEIVHLDSVPRATAAVAIALAAGVVSYTAVFAWAGLVSGRSLAYGLVYMLIWEGIITSLLGGVRYLSVRGYTLAIMHGLDTASFGDISHRVIEFPSGIVGVAVVTAGFLWLAVRRLGEMDVP